MRTANAPTRVPRVTVYGNFSSRTLSIAEALAFAERDDVTVRLILGAMRPGYLGRECVTLDDLRDWAGRVA